MRVSIFFTSRKHLGYRAEVQKSTSFGVREHELEFWFLYLFIVLVDVVLEPVTLSLGVFGACVTEYIGGA